MFIFLDRRNKMRRETSLSRNGAQVALTSHHVPQIISITLPQPRMRPKFHNLLMKSIQRRNHRCSSENNADQRKKAKTGWSKNGYILGKRIGLVIWNACSNRKAREMSSSPPADQPVESKEEEISFSKFLKSNSFSNVIPEAKETAVLKEEEEEEEEEVHEEENSDETDKKPVKMHTKISRFFSKSIGSHFHFRKWKVDKKSSNGETSQIIRCSKDLDEIRPVNPCSEGINVTEGREEDEEISEVELCKKRILMGEKCRPLNLSGALHYDKDGVLLPEL